MPNDPFWDKTKLLIHADDAPDPNQSSLLGALTCLYPDVVEVGSAFTRSIAVNNHLTNGVGRRGCYQFAYSESSADRIKFQFTEGNVGNNPDFTVEGWFYLTDLPQADNTYRQPFQAWQSSGSTYTQEFGFTLTRFSGTHRIAPKLRGSAPTVTYTFPINQWVHVALVAIGTTGYCYINGVAVHTWTIPITPANTASNGLLIGSYGALGNISFNGFASDFRFYKTAKYTANFMPLTDLPYPLAYADVRNFRAITGFGSASERYTADYKFGGGCMYFDGASYVSIPASSDFNFGTGDFTIECFVKRETGGSTYKVICGIWTNTFDRGWALALSNTDVLQFWARDNGSTEIGLSGQVPALNTWVHVAVSRQGANLYLFLEGYLAATRSDVGAQIFGNSATALYFGRRSSSAAEYFAGMVDEVRITKGAARYLPNTSFPLATEEFVMNADPLQSKTVLAMRMNTNSPAFIDDMGNTVTNNSAVACSATQSKFGGFSSYFDGATRYLSIAHAANHVIGTKSFCLDAWVYITATVMWNPIVVKGGVAADGTWFLGTKYGTNQLCFDVNGYVVIESVSSLPLNQWVHVAAIRAGEIVYLAINGIIVASVQEATALNTTGEMRIGRGRSNSTNYFSGYIDDVRVTVGSPRFLKFTLPTAAHPEAQTVVSGTVRDHTGALASRLVRVHARASGRLIGEMMSEPTTGAFSIGASEEAYAVVLDNTGNYNSLLLDRLDPLL